MSAIIFSQPNLKHVRSCRVLRLGSSLIHHILPTSESVSLARSLRLPSQKIPDEIGKRQWPPLPSPSSSIVHVKVVFVIILFISVLVVSLVLVLFIVMPSLFRRAKGT